MMKAIRDFYQTYKVYLTRPVLETLAVLVVIFSALWVYFSTHPSQGSLKLAGGMTYEGTLVRGKMTGKGTLTFKNGDRYEGDFKNGSFNGKGIFRAKSGWTYEGEFLNGQPEGKGVLTTEGKVVYKGRFKQGIYQNEN